MSPTAMAYSIRFSAHFALRSSEGTSGKNVSAGADAVWPGAFDAVGRDLTDQDFCFTNRA